MEMVCVIDLLKDWQTLIAAILALVAAYFTVRQMKRQMNLQRTESEDRRQRRLMACRAVMPADLSSVCRYAHDCALVSGRALLAIRNEEGKCPLKCPSLPERVVSNMQELTEHLDDRSADLLADLLSCYQIQHARLESELSYFNSPERFGALRVMTEDNFEFTCEQTVRLYLIAESMFKFARREEQEIPEHKFTEDQVSNALRVLELSDVISSSYYGQLVSLISDNKTISNETKNC